MTLWVALIRGINVGGKNIIPMNKLSLILQAIGLTNVKPYIQSGNVIFNSALDVTNDLSTLIATAIEESFGFSPRVFLLTADDIHKTLENNPFKQAFENPKSLLIFFLSRQPNIIDYNKLNAIKLESETFHLGEKIAYLYCPQGQAASKLAVKLEKILGVDTTARNLNTILKLNDLLKK